MKHPRCIIVLASCLLLQLSFAQDDEEPMPTRPPPNPVTCYETFGGVEYGFRHCRKDLPLRVHIFYNITDSDPEPETDAAIVMLVRAPHEGWVGFGFSLDGKMVGSNATVGWASPHDPENTQFGDFYLHDYLEPVDPLAPDGAQELEPVSPDQVAVEYVDGHTQLLYKRKLETAMAEELRVDDFAYIVYAMGDLPESADDPPMYHGRNMRAHYAYKFRTGDIKIILDPEVVAHAVCMVIAFGILIPGAIAVARYRKGMGPSILQNPWIKAYWFQIHIGMNILATAISFVAFMFGLFWFGTHFYKAHMAIGIITMVLTIMQPINGWMRPKKHSPVTTFYGQPTRYIWEKYHLWVGRCFPIFGWVNMIIGVTITEWTNLLIFILFVPFAFATLYFFMSIKFTDPEDKESVMLNNNKDQKDTNERTPLGVPMGAGQGIGYLGMPTPMFDARRPTV